MQKRPRGGNSAENGSECHCPQQRVVTYLPALRHLKSFQLMRNRMASMRAIEKEKVGKIVKFAPPSLRVPSVLTKNSGELAK